MPLMHTYADTTACTHAHMHTSDVQRLRSTGLWLFDNPKLLPFMQLVSVPK